MLKLIYKSLAKLEDFLLAVLMISSASMIVIQIIARSLFDYSFVWAEEFVRYAIIWMVFIGSGVAVRTQRHISIDVIKNILPLKLACAVNILLLLMSMAAAGLLLIYGKDLVVTMQKFGQLSPALEAPMYWFYLSIPISGGLMFIHLAVHLLAQTKALLTGQIKPQPSEVNHAI
ncbi:TRAP transporter small permease [Catenovulum sp. 2E275]|uniref:TRAP transporter small permease n=1 Tax=Catenovulum sp. 2E275 TaxID=2980497 RepID=UPI0021CFE166|nr:TRAP transporter small permease [Catenovulum sp. 2E275]MCU4677408.1 TRAP transporter small permease [Catenovulum sp. 2E275]